jgi:multidrug efflux system membrane fusion protein
MRAALALLAVLSFCAAMPAAAQQATSVIAIPSQAQSHTRVLTLRGRTEADRDVSLQAEIAGLIEGDPPRRGTLVSAGDVVCRLSAGERPAELAEARAGLIEAEAEVEAAERLVERGFTSQTETLKRRAALESARARMMRAELAMARLEIAAPFDGVLEDDAAERGTLLQPGGHCATIIAIDPVVLVGYAPEREVDALSVGQTATGRLVTGRTLEGVVRFVARTADPDTRTFRVEIAVPNPDLAIREGMTAEMEVALDAMEAHRLPQSALTLNREGALGVRVAEDGIARFYPVTVIDDAEDGMWVTGLPDRADVIVVGQEFVADGVPVAVSRPTAAMLRGAL